MQKTYQQTLAGFHKDANMKDIDVRMEYVIPEPGCKTVNRKSPRLETHKNQGETQKRELCENALEAAGRVEGLSLDVSTHTSVQIMDEEKQKGKYHQCLHLLKPIRTSAKQEHPVDNAGFFSFMTFSWMTTLAFTAYKKGQLLLEDVWPLSKYESSELNSRRLERLWQSELKECGQENASLNRVIWRFCQTRLVISVICLMVTMVAGFCGPLPTCKVRNLTNSFLHWNLHPYRIIYIISKTLTGGLARAAISHVTRAVEFEMDSWFHMVNQR